MKTVNKETIKWVLRLGVILWLLTQTSCIVISTVGTVATTAVNATVSVAGHTAKTAIDIIVPDGDDDDE